MKRYVNKVREENQRLFPNKKDSSWKLFAFTALVLILVMVTTFPATKENHAQVNKAFWVTIDIPAPTQQEGCSEDKFIIPEPSDTEIANLVLAISDHPRNNHLDSRKLSVNTEVYVPDGIFSQILVVNEDNSGGFSSKARDHLRDRKRHEMTMECLRRIIYGE